MKEKIKELITKLKAENEKRTEKMNSGTLSEYSHTVNVHTYNQTIEFIKELEKIIV